MNTPIIGRTDWLPLTPGGDLSKWWIDVPDALRKDGDALVCTGSDVRAEVGGMSWDNYVLSAEVMVRRSADDAYYQVELTAAGTCVYCQLLPGWLVLAYFDNAKNGTAHFGKAPLEIEDGVWHEFQMIAEGGQIAVAFDGRQVVAGQSPNGTTGMPGFVVNSIRNTEARMRNFRVRFLSPTAQQLREYELDATTNWRNYEESQQQKPG